MQQLLKMVWINHMLFLCECCISLNGFLTFNIQISAKEQVNKSFQGIYQNVTAVFH